MPTAHAYVGSCLRRRRCLVNCHVGVVNTAECEESFQSFLSILQVILPDNSRITLGRCSWHNVFDFLSVFLLFRQAATAVQQVYKCPSRRNETRPCIRRLFSRLNRSFRNSNWESLDLSTCKHRIKVHILAGLCPHFSEVRHFGLNNRETKTNFKNGGKICLPRAHQGRLLY